MLHSVQFQVHLLCLLNFPYSQVHIRSEWEAKEKLTTSIYPKRCYARNQLVTNYNIRFSHEFPAIKKRMRERWQTGNWGVCCFLHLFIIFKITVLRDLYAGIAHFEVSLPKNEAVCVNYEHISQQLHSQHFLGRYGNDIGRREKLGINWSFAQF